MKRTKNIALVAAALAAGLVLGNLGVSFARSPQSTTTKPTVAVVSASGHTPRSNVTTVAPSAPATFSPVPKAPHSGSTARTAVTRRLCPTPRHQSSTAGSIGGCGYSHASRGECGR